MNASPWCKKAQKFSTIGLLSFALNCLNVYILSSKITYDVKNFVFVICFSMRFHNPAYQGKTEDEKPILQPGLHEYTNPVHLKKNDSELSLDAKNLTTQLADV